MKICHRFHLQFSLLLNYSRVPRGGGGAPRGVADVWGGGEGGEGGGTDFVNVKSEIKAESIAGKTVCTGNNRESGGGGGPVFFFCRVDMCA